MKSVSAVIFLTLCGSCALSQRAIPEYLYECYTNTSLVESTLPLNLRTIVDILRKVEKHTRGALDMSTLSSSLLHRFKFDGIVYLPHLPDNEGILKVSGKSPQGSKHSLVEDLVPGDKNVFPSEALTLQERCTLHKAISNTIWDYYDDVDRSFCDLSIADKLIGRSSIGNTKKCPKEGGVILTQYGTVSLGSVIAAISAALQPQTVPTNIILQQRNLVRNDDDEVDDDLLILKDEMIRKSTWFQAISTSGTKLDNTWVATIAGELAEVSLYQGPFVPTMTFGATGSWNNTLLPKTFYVTSAYNNFDATRAEIIGGIDGINIARNLSNWVEKYNNLRMSQVLDMYYSEKGMVFNKEVKACKRGEIFQQIASEKMLKEKTYATAEALIYRNSVDYMSTETLQRLTASAVDEFTRYTNEQLFTEKKCQEMKVYPRVELIAAFDGSSTKTFVAALFAKLVDEFDVSMYGSKMGIIHGETGQWIQNVTNSPIEMYQGINNLTNISWPIKMNLTAVFNRVSSYLDEVWQERRKNHILGGYGQIVAILAPRTEPDEPEKKSALSVLREIKNNHPEVHFMYLVSEENSHFFAPFSFTDEDFILSKSSIDDISKLALEVPRTLRPDLNGEPNTIQKLEDYIDPSHTVTYRLHPKWSRSKKLIVSGTGYKSLKMCSWSKWTLKSETLTTYCKDFQQKDAELTDFWNCSKDATCPNVFYHIQKVSTAMECTDFECKTPDQVRYTLHFETMQSSSSTTIFNSILIIITVLKYIII